MISIKALLIGALIVAGGFLAGSLIRGFVEFLLTSISKQDKDDR